MSQAAVPVSLPAPMPIRIPIREIVPWAVLIGMLSLITMYFVSAEDGITALFSGGYVHEFLHDGRHLLAFPCH
ncbi:MAG: CbtB-domain containing protein [Actinophytocola sp.]|nr:CbtB-domain containing protein [Actinophytocola sp.]